jgi:hypothetical protein
MLQFAASSWLRPLMAATCQLVLGACPRIERPTAETPFWPDFPSILFSTSVCFTPSGLTRKIDPVDFFVK